MILMGRYQHTFAKATQLAEMTSETMHLNIVDSCLSNQSHELRGKLSALRTAMHHNESSLP
jgi:hypothetical protein